MFRLFQSKSEVLRMSSVILDIAAVGASIGILWGKRDNDDGYC